MALEKDVREKVGRREFDLRLGDVNGALESLQGELRSRCSSIDVAIQKATEATDTLRNRVVTVGLTVSTIVIGAMGILLAVRH